jgi:hypothetical protein
LRAVVVDTSGYYGVADDQRRTSSIEWKADRASEEKPVVLVVEEELCVDEARILMGCSMHHSQRLQE